MSNVQAASALHTAARRKLDKTHFRERFAVGQLGRGADFDDLHESLIVERRADLNYDLFKTLACVAQVGPQLSFENFDIGNAGLTNINFVDIARPVARDRDSQRIESLDHIGIVLNGADFLARRDIRGRVGRRKVERNLTFDGSWPKRQNKECEELKRHIEHGGQVQLDLAEIAFLFFLVVAAHRTIPLFHFFVHRF